MKNLKEEFQPLMEAVYYNSLLTESARIDFLKSKIGNIDTSHDSNAEHKNPGDVVDHFANNADPTKNKQHTRWVLDQYKKKNIRQEDAPRIHSALSNFEKYKGKLDKKDINSYKSVPEVEDAVHPHLNTPATNKEAAKEAAVKGRILVHEDKDGTKVYRLEPNEHGEKASKQIYGGGHQAGGTHTSWCTALDSKNCRFKYYSEEGPLHVIHTPNGHVYQSHVESNQLMDKRDDDVDNNHPDIHHIGKALDHVPEGWKLKLRRKIPGISKEHLDKAIDDDNKYVRGNAARHPNATKEHLDKALNDKDGIVRSGAAGNPNATKEHLDKALNDKDGNVRLAAAEHPNATKEHLDKALNDENSDVRFVAARHPNATKEHLDKALDDDNKYVRRNAANHPNATKEHLDKALNDKDSAVRSAAARHPNATKEHLDKALNDEDSDVRGNAARHPNATKEHLDKALNDKDGIVRSGAAGNPNATKEHLDKALNDKDGNVRSAAPRHPNATKEHLDKALNDKDDNVRYGAAGHPNATKEHLDKALNDKNGVVRSGAAGNPNATKEHLDKALNDDDKFVRSSAANNLARMSRK